LPVLIFGLESSGHPKQLSILVVATAVASIVCLVGATMGFTMLAKLLTASLLRDLVTQSPRCFPLGITLGICPKSFAGIKEHLP
jgi:hypothetical protein